MRHLLLCFELYLDIICYVKALQKLLLFRQSCDAVGTVVTSNTRDPRFEKSHQQNLSIQKLLLVLLLGYEENEHFKYCSINIIETAKSQKKER